MEFRCCVVDWGPVVAMSLAIVLMSLGGPVIVRVRLGPGVGLLEAPYADSMSIDIEGDGGRVAAEWALSVMYGLGASC